MSPQSRTPLLDALYREYLVGQDLRAFAVAVGSRYDVGTLERLSAVGDRMVRRAAVLALGQLADYGSNAAVGRALQDAEHRRTHWRNRLSHAGRH